MFIAVLSGFVVAAAAPWLARAARGAAGWWLGIFPLGLAVYFASFANTIAEGQSRRWTIAWVPSLGVQFSFYLDGLSLLFAVLISGIGAAVVVYAGGYFVGHVSNVPGNSGHVGNVPHVGRFYACLLMFMASMLGVVLADNAVTLFLFWELTSLSSYLLIGFDHEREASRAAALQALLVTGMGGLALLAGLLLLGRAGGSLELSELLTQGDAVRQHSLYPALLVLILLGAFTKSAQFPFHFWLPSAMEAPTPVSAYLHSATMVKAGVYLLARLSPVLGGSELWLMLVTAAGTTTMLIGGWLAIQQSDAKHVLAYSTVSVLGALTLLLGVGTPTAIRAAVVYLFAHSLYKGTLFLVAGAVDHETGTRDVDRLSGLRRAMPRIAVAAGLAAFSMAGLPPLCGFFAKELFYESVLHGPAASLLTVAGVLGSLLLVAVAMMVGLRPFWGPLRSTPKAPHDAPASLWLGPVLLAVLGLVVGIWPAATDGFLLRPAAVATLGPANETASFEPLALWHGWNLTLALSGATLVGGVGIFAVRERLRAAGRVVAPVTKWGPARWYALALDGLKGFADFQTRLLQNGYLRFYLLTILGLTVSLVGFAWLRWGVTWGTFSTCPKFAGTLETGPTLALVTLILLAATVAVRTRSRLGAVAALGVVGYAVALIYVVYGAPDLAMTQFLIETLTVILLVLVFYYLPGFANLSRPGNRLRDLFVAVTVGGVMAGLVLLAAGHQFAPTIASYYAEQSRTLAHGRNVVNVILVDFRGLDTLGEITVLAVAAVGVYALLKLRIGKGGGA